MKDCNHIWEYRHFKNGCVPEFEPYIVLECVKCNRAVQISIEKLINSKYAEYVVDEVDNSPGAMLDRASDKLALPTNIFRGDSKYIFEAIIASCMINNNRIGKLESNG